MLKQNELDVLHAIATYDFLTIEQVQRVLARRDYGETLKLLRRMYDRMLVTRKRLPPRATLGNATWLYKLGPRGEDALIQDPGFPGPSIPRFDMGDDPAWVSVHYWHQVYTNWFFITANVYEESYDTVAIVDFRTEMAIKRDRANFPAPPGVIPDGWLDMKFKDMEQCFILELETGTQKPAVVRKKIHNLIEFAKGAYQQRFGTDSLTYLFLAEDDKHRDTISNAITQVWEQEGLAESPDVFLVTDCAPWSLKLFTKPVWYVPGGAAPRRLFE